MAFSCICPRCTWKRSRFTTYGFVQLEEIRKNEDPRLSFATPEFKEAQRTFTERFKVCQKTCRPPARACPHNWHHPWY